MKSELSLVRLSYLRQRRRHTLMHLIEACQVGRVLGNETPSTKPSSTNPKVELVSLPAILLTFKCVSMLSGIMVLRMSLS